MRLVRTVKSQEIFVVRLPFTCDLLSELTRFCRERGIRLGHLSGLGAVRRAVIAYYDQSKRQYENRVLNEPMEIISLLGNISMKEEQPFVHAHIALARRDGSVIGGHLCEGTEVFAGECVIEAFAGDDLVRAPDPDTGLQLWKFPNP